MSEQTKGTSRFEFLNRFLGKEDAQKFDEAVNAQEAILDGKVERKAFDEEKAKGILEKLQESVRKPLAQFTDNVELQDKLATQFIASVMGALQELEGGEEVVEELPIEEFAEGEEEEEEFPAETMQLAKTVVDLATESNAVNKELQELIPAFIGMAETVKALAPLVEKTKQVNVLEERIKKLEALVALTPRSASQSESTVVDSPELKAIIDKGVSGETKTVWGHAVKPEVN